MAYSCSLAKTTHTFCYRRPLQVTVAHRYGLGIIDVHAHVYFSVPGAILIDTQLCDVHSCGNHNTVYLQLQT